MKPRRQTLIPVDLQKLAESTDGVLIIRLAMVANDIAAANAFSLMASKCGMNPDVVNGLRMYAIRLQLGHLREGMKLFEETLQCRGLNPYLIRVSNRIAPAIDLLKQALEGGSDHPAFRKRVHGVRDKVGFHYDKAEARKALHYLASQSRQHTRLIVIGDDQNTSRFSVADAVVDREVFHVIWGVDPSAEDSVDHTRAAIDEVALWCQERAKALHTFACNICMDYLLDRCPT